MSEDDKNKMEQKIAARACHPMPGNRFHEVSIRQNTGQWRVERWSAGAQTWCSISESVGNKSYASRYLNALDSIYPRPHYRLITNMGEVFEVRQGSDVPRANKKAEADNAGK
jgi:hypothetical protein